MVEENGALCCYGSLARGLNVTSPHICLVQVLEAMLQVIPTDVVLGADDST